MPEPVHKGETVFRGIGVSSGVARGKILVLGKSRHTIAKQVLSDAELPGEVSRLQKALVQTRHEILEVQRKVTAAMGASEGDIFNAHLLVLEDSTLIDGVVRLIENQKVNAEHAFHTVAEDFTAKLAAIEDEYLRERAGDMRDVTSRVLNNLLGKTEEFNLRDLQEPVIIVSHDLTPSKTAQMDRTKVLGFATDVGSKPSHTAIMARSLRIPGVVGLRNMSEELHNGQYALVDGFNGTVILNPTDQTLFEYGQLIRKQVSLEEKLRDEIGRAHV